MRSFFVTRDKRGWKYRENKTFGWSRFDNSVTDEKSMQDYFRRGNHDPASLIFTDENGNLANVFELRKRGQVVDAKVNGGREFEINERQVVGIDELTKYIYDRTNPEVIERSVSAGDPLSRLQFLKENAEPEIREGYNLMLSEKMTKETIINKLSEYEAGKQSVVHFIED